MMSSPPRLAVWLLSRRLSPEWRDFVLGDLEEEFKARRDRCVVWWRRSLPVEPRALPDFRPSVGLTGEIHSAHTLA